jgi:hypothetical protein
MPVTSNDFTYIAYLKAGLTEFEEGSQASDNTLTDNKDDAPDGYAAIGNEVEVSYFFSAGDFRQETTEILGWTENGVIVRGWGTSPAFDYVLLSNVSYSVSATITPDTVDDYPFCFLEGTDILTTNGPMKIEDLTLEHTVVTHGGKERAIRWVGTQTVDNNIRTSSHRAPVKIARGALGHDLPSKDLVVTGSHAIYLNGQLINASVLVNGSTITQVSLKDMPDTFTYYHIETDAHEAIIANGLAAETFVDAPDRKAFDNYTEYVDTYGVERIIPEMDVPRITAVRHLPEDLRVSLGINVEETDWAALVADSSTGLTLKQVG